MNKDSDSLVEETKILSTFCLTNAKDLLRAAKTVLEKDRLPNIAYHLAVIALEEVGKADLIIFKNRASFGDLDGTFSDRKLENHIAKLFWALWGPSFGREVITKEQIEDLQGLARNIHERRLDALYTEAFEFPSKHPRETISEEQANKLILMVEQRIIMEENQPIRDLNVHEKHLMNWLINSIDDSGKRAFIMSRKSMEKLAGLGNVQHWIEWMIAEFDKYEEEATALTQEELKRSEPIGKEKHKPKWKIKIRFFTASHSIRTNVFKTWNEKYDWVKLTSIPKKKNQFLAEFNIPTSVSMNALWWVGWNMARKFIVAFNIGSFGHFWWYVPTYTSKFYEEIIDINEPDFYVNIQRSPKLEINWSRSALSEMDLRNIALSFAGIPNRNDSNGIEIFDYYFTALSFLSKTDIHLGLEANSFEQFYKSLKSAMLFYKDWDGKSDFDKSFSNMISELVPTMDDGDKYITLFKQFETTPVETKGLTLEEVAAVKVILDGYLLRQFKKQFSE